MEEKLKRTFGRIDIYLDFHSVVGGFRDIGLIGLIDNDNFRIRLNQNKNLQIPVFCEQLKFLKNYLKKNNLNYNLIPAWAHLYFIAKKNKITEINNFLKEYPIPIKSKEGGKRLGLLLNYPECCVNNASKRNKETSITKGDFIDTD